MPTTRLTRAELSTAFPQASPKVIRALEEQQRQTDDNAATLASSADATNAIQDATVITLSPNASFNNERVLARSGGITLTDNGSQLIIGLSFRLTIGGGYRLNLNLAADTNLGLPPEGNLLAIEYFDQGPYADDAAAAAGGIAVDRPYRRADGVVAWRVA